MKPLSKILLRTAAILPVVALCFRKIRNLYWLNNSSRFYTLGNDAISHIGMVFELISLAAACFIIYHYRNAMPEPDKRFRLFTHIASISMLVVVIGGLTQLVSCGEYNYWLYIPYWLRIICVAIISTWLWMFSNRPGKSQLSKPVATLILCGGIIVSLVLVIMLVAGAIVLKTGHVFETGLHSGLYYNWVCMLVPTILLNTYAFTITSKHVRENILTAIVWGLFSVSVLTTACHNLLNHFNYLTGVFERKSVHIAPITQDYVKEEMDSLVQQTSPKWASAIVMDVHTGVVLATYSSDSVEHFRDTLDFGTLTMPLQLLEAIRCNNLSPYATTDIHKEGITIDGLRYVDSHPCDTTLDMAGIIAASSQVGAATLLSQCNPNIYGNIFERKSTMMDIADDYCYIADDLNCPLHDHNMDMIQQGLHKVVWDNKIGTASVGQWNGNISAYKVQSDAIHIAGKTGTTQICRDGVYHANEHRISFVGYFPEEAPRYCCLVVLDTPSNSPYEAGYDCGGTVRRIAERIYLH